VPKSPDAETRTIVVHVDGRIIGCLVDSVTQVVRIDREAIRRAPETVTGSGASYIAGFARVEEQLVVLLEIEELLDSEKLERFSREGLPDGLDN
jgi:purine-binding chemotaxis protein CheW